MRQKAIDLFDDGVITITSIPSPENPEQYRVANARKTFGFEYDISSAMALARANSAKVIYYDSKRIWSE